MKPPIGITLGEPCGIGPEIVLKSLAATTAREDLSARIYGSLNLIEATARTLDIAPFWSTSEGDRIQVVPCGPNPTHGRFSSDQERAAAVLATLEAATEDGQRGTISALLTAPLDKSIARQALPTFTGHTSFLAQRANIPKAVMMLDNTELRVALLTEHVALRNVASMITASLVEQVVHVACRSFQEWFSMPHPTIAVAGINPHAGEITSEAEERTVLHPAIERLRKQGVSIEGPFPADSLFTKARQGVWDLIVSAYHDQGLIAAKYPGLHQVVNITLGLPYLRLSPGHGVAYDIAGQGKADIRSFQRCLQIASTRRLTS